MEVILPEVALVEVDGVKETVPLEEFYDELGEDLSNERQWSAIKNNLKDLPEIQQEAVKRWTDLEALQAHYTEFSDFLYDAMTELMGFNCTDVQIDIGNFLQYGEKYSMIQAQRSQAKSTIVAIFAVWLLIHDPKTRVLIISAGADVAMEIANWVIQIIMNWDMLKCLRPDRQHGDRASAKAFDIHWQLKGVEKSPSVACIGVTANMQGRRADILIPDDIESSKNGLTETQRQNLIHLSRDFTSICQNGRIIYLGTPQTSDSIYNTLPGRGFTIRVWTGRYPTLEEQKNYGTHLAPMLIEKMRLDPSLRTGGGITGDSGKPTDPVLLGEQLLISKELDQGTAYFQLQHMLNTQLSDEGRYPLKTRDLIVMALNLDTAPGEITWMPDPRNKFIMKGYSQQPELYRPFSIGDDMYEYEARYMYVDTAGGGANGDETVAWAVYFLHGYIFGVEMLALKGGYSEENYEKLSAFAFKHKVQEIGVEQNHGYGAFAQAWRPVLMKYYKKQTGSPHSPRIDDDWVSTQKELRIIDTLEPLMTRHRVIINEDVFEHDIASANKYPIDLRMVYTLVNQINKITRDRGALIHDDRIDGFAAAVRKFVDRMAVDEDTRIAQKTTSENMKLMDEWSEGSDFRIAKHGLGNILSRKGNVLNRSKLKKRRY